MSVRVAVVGVGYLGQHHARVYSELENVELVGVVDKDLDRAKEVAARHSSRAYANYKEILKDLDALSIAVPTIYHYDVALDCIRAGKDILIEKPVAATLQQADELISEAEKMKLILQVGHLERYNPGVLRISEMIEKPVFLETLRQSPFLNRATDVDVTIDLMIHDIDIILSLVNSEIKTIKAEGLSSVTDKIDEASAWLEFENGASAYLKASRMAQEKQRRLRVFEKNNCLELDYQQGSISRYNIPGQAEEARDINFSAYYGLELGEPAEVIKPEYREPLKEELKDFINCVCSRQRPKVSGREGRKALQVALEINSLIGAKA